KRDIRPTSKPVFSDQRLVKRKYVLVISRENFVSRRLHILSLAHWNSTTLPDLKFMVLTMDGTMAAKFAAASMPLSMRWSRSGGLATVRHLQRCEKSRLTSWSI